MAGFFVAQATAVSSGIPICVTAVRMQSARFVTEPANAPSETRVALFPVTFTSSPPNVYCPSGHPRCSHTITDKYHTFRTHHF